MSKLSMSGSFWGINFCWFHFQLSDVIFPALSFIFPAFWFGLSISWSCTLSMSERFWEINFLLISWPALRWYISYFQISHFLLSDLDFPFRKLAHFQCLRDSERSISADFISRFHMVYFLLSDFTFPAWRFGFSISESCTVSMSDRFWEINFCSFHISSFQMLYFLLSDFTFPAWRFDFPPRRVAHWEILRDHFQLSDVIFHCFRSFLLFIFQVSCWIFTFWYPSMSQHFCWFRIFSWVVSIFLTLSNQKVFNVCFWSKFSRTHDIYRSTAEVGVSFLENQKCRINNMRFLKFWLTSCSPKSHGYVVEIFFVP